MNRPTVKRTLSPDLVAKAPAPVSGRVTPADGSDDADTPPRPPHGRTGARTGSPDADPPMPGQTELILTYRQVTLWSL
ncbi:hypothetical protein ACFZBE_17915 [Streptomyces sp. NPDC008061]|uniref:hypothetical protein n=1 Tax=Streptomyces sp. NPDC008061 TaxID=3364805 RepID=UPI0036E70D14